MGLRSSIEINAQIPTPEGCQRNVALVAGRIILGVHYSGLSWDLIVQILLMKIISRISESLLLFSSKSPRKPLRSAQVHIILPFRFLLN